MAIHPWPLVITDNAELELEYHGMTFYGGNPPTNGWWPVVCVDPDGSNPNAGMYSDDSTLISWWNGTCFSTPASSRMNSVQAAAMAPYPYEGTLLWANQPDTWNPAQA